ncbi:hypothetical protein SESBI_10472 [Sesbania bispinosa]|nr:hypothetical protein SESBI_10472 [Sesbania bispinosa]
MPPLRLDRAGTSPPTRCDHQVLPIVVSSLPRWWYWRRQEKRIGRSLMVVNGTMT